VGIWSGFNLNVPHSSELNNASSSTLTSGSILHVVGRQRFPTVANFNNIILRQFLSLRIKSNARAPLIQAALGTSFFSRQMCRNKKLKIVLFLAPRVEGLYLWLSSTLPLQDMVLWSNFTFLIVINWLTQLIEQNSFRENDCCPASQSYSLFIETEVKVTCSKMILILPYW